jgi:hypothetical protein
MMKTTKGCKAVDARPLVDRSHAWPNRLEGKEESSLFSRNWLLVKGETLWSFAVYRQLCIVSAPYPYTTVYYTVTGSTSTSVASGASTIDGDIYSLTDSTPPCHRWDIFGRNVSILACESFPNT